MKCKYCNSELRRGAKFCSNCGKEVADIIHKEETVLQEKEAIKEFEKPQNVVMSATQNVDCPIAEPQSDNVADTLEPYESEHSSKKWLWILGIVLILAVAGGGWYFFGGERFGNGAMTPIEEDVDSIAEVETSGSESSPKLNFIKNMYKNFYEPYNAKRFDEKTLSKYFTKKAMTKFYVEDEYSEGELYYDTDFLLTGVIGGKGDYGDKVISRTIVPEREDWFLVTNIWDVVQTPLKVHLQVELIDGAYKIVDLSEDSSETSASEITTVEPVPVISIADILGTNGKISLLVKSHGFKEQTYISGRGAECHYYYKNCVIEDDNPVPVDKNTAVCIDCTYGIDGEETIIEVYNYNAYKQLVDEVIKLSKGKNGDDYILQWANNQNISVRLYDKGEEYGGSIIIIEPQ